MSNRMRVTVCGSSAIGRRGGKGAAFDSCVATRHEPWPTSLRAFVNEPISSARCLPKTSVTVEALGWLSECVKVLTAAGSIKPSWRSALFENIAFQLRGVALMQACRKLCGSGRVHSSMEAAPALPIERPPAFRSSFVGRLSGYIQCPAGISADKIPLMGLSNAWRSRFSSATMRSTADIARHRKAA